MTARTPQAGPAARQARAATTAQPPRRPGLVLAVIATAQLMVVLDLTIVVVALPHIQAALGFSGSNLEWVVNAYAVAFGGLLLLGGRTGDLLGRRRILIAGLLVFSLASLLGGLATGQAWLIAARAVQGAGAAMAAPTALSLVAVTFPEGRPRNRAVAVYSAMAIVGIVAGLIAGGLLVTYLPWRWVLFVNVPIGLVVAALAARVLPETGRRGRAVRPARRPHRDRRGRGLGIRAVQRGDHPGRGISHWGDAKVVASLAAAAVLLVAFGVIEARSSYPLLPFRVLRSRDRSGAYLISLCVGTALVGMFFFLTLFMQDVWGYSALKTAAAYLPFVPAVLATTAIAQQAVSRIGARPLLIAGSVIVGRRDVLAVPDHRAQHLRRRDARAECCSSGRPGPAVRADHPGRADQGERPATPAWPPAWSTSGSRSAARSGWRSSAPWPGARWPAACDPRPPRPPRRPRPARARPRPRRPRCRPGSTTTRWPPGSPGVTWSRRASWR